MSTTRTIATAFLAAAALGALAACGSTGSHNESGAAQPVTAPTSSATQQQTGNANQPAGSVAQSSSTAAKQQAPAGPEFAGTTVYGLVTSARINNGVLQVTWDKADWTFYPASKSRLGHLKACETNDHGNILTNCSHSLRTTVVPSAAQIRLTFSHCQAGEHIVTPDPLHHGDSVGNALTKPLDFVMLTQGCAAATPGPDYGGVWLTFNTSGALTKIAERVQP